MADWKTKTDAELVAIALEDCEVFGRLVERYEQKLARYVKRLVGLSKECVEDVLQEVFLKVYRNLNSYDPGLSFSSWIYRITHNETVNYVKKHRKQNVVSLENDDDAVSLIEVLASDVDVVDDARKKERIEKVHRILQGMTEKYREVLILKFLEDKDYAEISDIIKKPMGTVATLINRAKKQFITLYR